MLDEGNIIALRAKRKGIAFHNGFQYDENSKEGYKAFAKTELAKYKEAK